MPALIILSGEGLIYRSQVAGLKIQTAVFIQDGCLSVSILIPFIPVGLLGEEGRTKRTIVEADVWKVVETYAKSLKY